MPPETPSESTPSPKILSPSANYEINQKTRLPTKNYALNQKTLAYRLSESVFGSLLASYLLGFIGFVAVYIQPTQKFDIYSVGVGPSINTLAQFPAYPDGIIILHYLVISTIFSIFTVTVYFN